MTSGLIVAKRRARQRMLRRRAAPQWPGAQSFVFDVFSYAMPFG